MPKTVLFVDDDALFRQAIGDGLRAAGYRVILAADGLEALEEVRKAPPDFILLDLIMPKLDGFRVCKMLKGHPQHRTIPVIVLTGLGREAMKSLPELGAEASVVKREAEATLTEVRKTLQLLGSARLKPVPLVDSAKDLAERRIVSELLAEREHIQTVLANLGEGVLELDDRGQVLYANRAALQMLGAAEVEILGSSGPNLLGAANAGALQRALRQVQESGRSYPVRLDLRHGELTLGLTLTTFPRPDAPPGVLLVLRDLTDLTRRARNLAAVAAVCHQVLARLDSAAVLREIVTRAADVLETDRCALFQVDRTGATERLRCVQACGLSEGYVQSLTLAVGEAVVGRAIERRRAVFTADILRDPDVRPPAALRGRVQQEGIGAILAVPMLVGQEALGALAVYRPAGHRFSLDEMELVTCLAEAAAIAIENARLYAEVQRHSRELERRLEERPRSG